MRNSNKTHDVRGGNYPSPPCWNREGHVTTHHHDETAVEGGNHHDHGISMTWPMKAVREENLYK
jgi:hypothetical protein